MIKLNKHEYINGLIVAVICGCDLVLVIFKLKSMIDILNIPYEIAFEWMPQDLTDDEPTLVQVIGWRRQITRHYQNQRWLWSMTPYGAIVYFHSSLIVECMGFKAENIVYLASSVLTALYNRMRLCIVLFSWYILNVHNGGCGTKFVRAELLSVCCNERMTQ